MKNLTTIITAIFLLTSITTAQNYSLSFDGTDDYVDVSYTSGQIGSEISISAWVNLSSNSNGGHIIFNGCCGTDATWYWGMILEHSDAGGGIQPKIMLHTDQGINGAGHKPPSGTGIITPNSGWHYVAMTYGSNTLKIYLDVNKIKKLAIIIKHKDGTAAASSKSSDAEI